CQHYYSTPSSL
nr:immunoglobulin light chain junction region [Macaca mulatta]